MHFVFVVLAFVLMVVGMALSTALLPSEPERVAAPRVIPPSFPVPEEELDSENPGVLPLAGLIYAIAEIESGDNPAALGRHGEVGWLQIRPIMVEEVNRIAEKLDVEYEFHPSDRYSIDRSVEMFYLYSKFWADRHEDYSLEGIARRWNGGPDGHMEDATLAYWMKVRARIWTE